MTGKTLYVFDGDLGSAGSTCNDTCATNWPPVLVTDGEVSSLPGLSMITRDDDTMQAAFMGRPLYFYIGDEAAGDMNGDGVNDVWHKVMQPQVSLQIQGSNVVTKDIYTTNGVIHVIDTVITETLE
jgi:predicted lipoprotein with Yx(FWY)xxD motif